MRRLVVIALLAGCAVEREQPACTDCAAQGVHPVGYALATSSAFHGLDIERRGWDLALCQSCHGQDFAGKGNAPSCLSCHENKPTACTTCHENPPTTAAHTTHLAKGFSCTDCHEVPASWEAHRKPTTRAALVTFGALAKTKGATPTWDGAKCTNVYCHGAAQPVWNGMDQATCGSCHGVPPASHARADCATCHPSTTHVNGVVDLNGGGACNGCHGDAQSAAPATGAHRKHLSGGYFTQPLACSECHRVPTNVTDPGHIDTAEPAEVTFGTLASSDAATPAWNHATSTCTNVYCHGGGTKLSTDTAPNWLYVQSWKGTGATTAYCGACHGLPPTTSPHTPAMQITDCETCHPQTVGPFGNVLVANGKHMNGVADAQ